MRGHFHARHRGGKRIPFNSKREGEEKRGGMQFELGSIERGKS